LSDLLSVRSGWILFEEALEGNAAARTLWKPVVEPLKKWFAGPGLEDQPIRTVRSFQAFLLPVGTILRGVTCSGNEGVQKCVFERGAAMTIDGFLFLTSPKRRTAEVRSNLHRFTSSFWGAKPPELCWRSMTSKR